MKSQSTQGASVKSGLSEQQTMDKAKEIRTEGGKNQIPHPQKDGKFKY
jgi:hypothetical protein